VAAKADALLGDAERLAVAVAAVRGAALDLVGHRPVAHREHLEAARVGDDRVLPAHEVVQPAEPLDPLVPRVEEQVIGVAQHHVVAEVAHLGRREAADRGLGRQRHERGRAHLAVGGAQHPGPRPRARIAGQDLQRRRHPAPD
jgi:cyanate lyase